MANTSFVQAVRLRAVAAPNGETIALCMIVRDEAAIVERCLASVEPLIDTWVICDTGSSDRTPDAIRDALRDIPGQLHFSEWRDFGINRSELMQLARGAADYLLLLDADHTLRATASLPPLTADAYLVRHSGLLEYAVPRLVRGDRPWRFEGSTHEYLAAEGAFTQDRLAALVVDDHADGSARSEKLKRDRRLLERDLRRDPRDARATFYLAQTCLDLGDVERASELYQRRIELGGWDEEVFYAALQAGRAMALRDPEVAVPLLIEASRLRPSRAEPLYELARVCRFLRRYRDAYDYAVRGLELPYPDDVLFVHRPVYEWGLRFEYAVAAYWLGETQTALDENESLLQSANLPAEIRAAVEENRDFCLSRLEQGGGRATRARRRPGALERLANLAPGTELGEIRLDVSPEWPQFNPTIASDGKGGARMIVRTANYLLEEGGWYRFLDPDGVIRTVNYLVELDNSLAVRRVRPLVGGPEDGGLATRVQGYEDCRLVQLGERWFATATTRDRNPEELCQVALLALEEALVADVKVLRGPVEGRHEKNWMPFVRDGALLFVYSCRPTVVFACDTATGGLDLCARHPAFSGAVSFRGGSQGVAVAGGFLFVVHEAGVADGARSYSHRFVLVDEMYRLHALSPPFRFATAGVEFCAGLTRHASDFVLSFGVRDRAAGLAVVPEGEVLALLDEAPAY